MEDNNKKPIPAIFHSFEGEPFRECMKCQKNLMSEEAEYMIERAFIPNDIVFEYAICVDCALSMRETMSKESRQNLDNFFQKHVSEHMLSAIFRLGRPDTPIEDLLAKCLVTGKHISRTDRYQIVGYFKGGFMQSHMPPFVISEEAAEQVQELLSQETKDEFDDFIDEFLGLPPELKELFKDSDILILT